MAYGFVRARVTFLAAHEYRLLMTIKGEHATVIVWTPGRWWFAVLDSRRGKDRPDDAPGARARPAPNMSPEAEFEAFFWRFERRVIGVLWHMTGDEQAARDLAQETFLRAWQRFDAIAAHRETGHWLLRVATNLALTWLRRRNAPVGAAGPLTDDPAASDPGSHIVERDLVRTILAAMPPRQRAVLVLHDLYGFSGAELAATLGISRDAAKMALWRAREQFRARYLRAGEDH